MIYGYARVSTAGQARDGNSLEDQERKLTDAGCGEIYVDSCTGTKMERPEFAKLLSRLKDGDRLVVTKLDRFARTTVGGVSAIQDLLKKGVSVHVLNMGLIDDTPAGKLIVTVLLAFAEYERDNIVERTATGKATAKSTRPDWKDGRKPKAMDETTVREMNGMVRDGKVTVAECCARLNISRATWYRVVKQLAA